MLYLSTPYKLFGPIFTPDYPSNTRQDLDISTKNDHPPAALPADHYPVQPIGRHLCSIRLLRSEHTTP